VPPISTASVTICFVAIDLSTNPGQCNATALPLSCR
jgi:hypothetical protein